MRLGVVGSFVLGLASVAGLGLDLSSLRAEDSPPAEIISPSEPRTPAEERRGFHLPAGFEAQLVAAEPDIHKPMNIAFDDRGRLWVTDTLEYPFPAPGRAPAPATRVKVLDDFGPDGRARKITTFADGLNIPIGVLPLPAGRSALVYSIPEICRLTDTDGDGQADRRESLYQLVRIQRHARDDELVHLGLRRLDLRLPRLRQHVERARARTAARSPCNRATPTG